MIDFVNLFVRSSGETLYFFAVIVLSLASFFMILGQRLRAPQNPQMRRLIWAFTGIVLVWLFMLLGALVPNFSDYSAAEILPPLERFATSVTVLLLLWAFLYSPSASGGRSGLWAALGMIVLAVGYAFTAIQWLDVAGEMDFNLSSYGVSWTFLAAALSGVGGVLMLLYLSSVNDAPLKLVVFAILFAGAVVTLVQVAQGEIIGDYVGVFRLTFVIGQLLVPALIYRAVVGQLEADMRVIRQSASQAQSAVAPSASIQPSQPQARPAVTTPIERESVQLLKALGLILDTPSAANVPDRIIQAVIEVFKFDVVGLLRLQDANYADVMLAYDRVMERALSGVALNLDVQPTLASAIEARAQRVLKPELNRRELEDLYVRLDVEQMGPVYIQPLVHDKTLIAVLIACAPYSKRELLKAEQETLKGVGVIASGLLALSFAASDSEKLAEERTIQELLRNVQLGDSNMLNVHQDSQEKLALARQQIAELTKQVMSLKVQLDGTRNQVALDLDNTDDTLSASQQIRLLNQEHDTLREERDRLTARLQEAEAALSGATAADEQGLINAMVETLQREKDDLLAERERLQAQLTELESDDGVIPQAVMQKLIGQMESDHEHLQKERDALQRKLVDIQRQLKSFGIDGDTAGLATLIGNLYEQRATLQVQNRALQDEFERVAGERERLEAAVHLEEARMMRVQQLETEVNNLAGDREALTKQVDKLRVERDEFEQKVDLIKEHRARVMAQAAAYESELKESHAAQSNLRAKLKQAAVDFSALLKERDRLLAERQALETDKNQLIARIDGDRDRLEQVGEQGVGSLTAMIDELTTQRSQLQEELTTVRDQLSDTQNQIDLLQARVGKGQPADGNVTYEARDPDLLMGLLQELRTPMTSITGYVDLLLSESTGILGAAQRKFMQRVSTNVSRLSIMLEDLVKIAQLDAGVMSFKPMSVDVIHMIEEAITDASTQFREKGLAVNLNLDYSMEPVDSDRDAIYQIFGQLLTNAYLVSPPDTDIFITADRRDIPLQGEQVNALYIAVEDRGGGILPEDEARVFARKYKAENPLIEGLGDTGVGLAIAKALAEAQGGDLWLEVRENIGTVFHFAMPIKTTSVQVEE